MKVALLFGVQLVGHLQRRSTVTGPRLKLANLGMAFSSPQRTSSGVTWEK